MISTFIVDDCFPSSTLINMHEYENTQPISSKTMKTNKSKYVQNNYRYFDGYITENIVTKNKNDDINRITEITIFFVDKYSKVHKHVIVNIMYFMDCGNKFMKIFNKTLNFYKNKSTESIVIKAIDKIITPPSFLNWHTEHNAMANLYVSSTNFVNEIYMKNYLDLINDN